MNSRLLVRVAVLLEMSRPSRVFWVQWIMRPAVSPWQPQLIHYRQAVTNNPFSSWNVCQQRPVWTAISRHQDVRISSVGLRSADSREREVDAALHWSVAFKLSQPSGSAIEQIAVSERVTGKSPDCSVYTQEDKVMAQHVNAEPVIPFAYFLWLFNIIFSSCYIHFPQS